jgi:hypothetical protein
MPEPVRNNILHPGDWWAAGGWRTIGGRKLFVTTHGHGAPVLPLHGFPTASIEQRANRCIEAMSPDWRPAGLGSIPR